MRGSREGLRGNRQRRDIKDGGMGGIEWRNRERGGEGTYINHFLDNCSSGSCDLSRWMLL